MMRAILMASAFSMQIWKKQEGFCVKKTWKQRMRLGAAAWMLAMLAAGCGGNDKLVSDPQAKYDPVPEVTDEMRMGSGMTAAIYDAFDAYFAQVPHDGSLVLKQTVEPTFDFRDANKKDAAYPVISKIVCYNMRVGYAAGGLTANEDSLGFRLAPDVRASGEAYTGKRSNYINLVVSSKQGSREMLSNDFLYFQDAKVNDLTEHVQFDADRALLATPSIHGTMTLEKVDEGIKITYERPAAPTITKVLPMKVYGFMPWVTAHNFGVTVEMYQ